MEKYRVTTHRFEGLEHYGEKPNDFKWYTYTLTFNKSMQHTGRHNAMCYGMNEQEVKERIGKFRYYFRRLWHAIINKKQF